MLNTPSQFGKYSTAKGYYLVGMFYIFMDFTLLGFQNDGKNTMATVMKPSLPTIIKNDKNSFNGAANIL